MRHIDPETIEAAAGETVEVELTAHGVGGYEWRLEDAGALEPLGESVHTADDAAPGAGGIAAFSFTAASAGRTELVFALQRGWEDEPLRTRRVVVDVRA